MMACARNATMSPGAIAASARHFRHIGGLPGAVRWLVGVGGVAVAGMLAYVELIAALAACIRL